MWSGNIISFVSKWNGDEDQHQSNAEKNKHFLQENLVGLYIKQYVTNSNDGLRFFILMNNAFISINCNFYSKVTLQPLIKKRGWGPVILTPTHAYGLG